MKMVRSNGFSRTISRRRLKSRPRTADRSRKRDAEVLEAFPEVLRRSSVHLVCYSDAMVIFSFRIVQPKAAGDGQT